MKQTFWNKTEMGHTTSKDGRFHIHKEWATGSYYITEHGTALHDTKCNCRLHFGKLKSAKAYCENL